MSTTELPSLKERGRNPLPVQDRIVSYDEDRRRRREWNRGPLKDLFPRIPDAALESLLDLCIGKGFTYNLSDSGQHNARRYTSIVVAHVRHTHTNYDQLLRDGDGENSGGLERYEARQQTGERAWSILKAWSPWESSNPALKGVFLATLLTPGQRDPQWDPMDLDIDLGDEEYVTITEQSAATNHTGMTTLSAQNIPAIVEEEYLEDLMDLD